MNWWTPTQPTKAQFTTTDYVCGDDWTIRELSPSEGYLLDDTVYPVGALSRSAIRKNIIPLRWM